MGIELTTEQIHAVYNAETWFRSPSSKQVFEISGPAGSGKTTLVLYIIEHLGLKIKDVLFCAYMGKAACQLIRNGLPAQTIHSAIYIAEKKYEKNEYGSVIKDEFGRPKKKMVFRKKQVLDKKYKLIVVDEGSTVDSNIAADLMSFGIPMIVLGDLNQLPPVFGRSVFLVNPDVILTKVMRQNEGNPIIYLSQQVLEGKKLEIGVYGKSSVILQRNLKIEHFKKADTVLTCTNALRGSVNDMFREKIKRISRLDFPAIGEKVVCRKNNWKKCVLDTFYLTNGTIGYIEEIDKSTFDGKTFEMDFRPDFLEATCFKNLVVDYKHLITPVGSTENNELGYFFNDKFEYAYAITVHISQGSQYDNVLFLSDDMMGNTQDRRKMLYTAITRASKVLTIVI